MPIHWPAAIPAREGTVFERSVDAFIKPLPISNNTYSVEHNELVFVAGGGAQGLGQYKPTEILEMIHVPITALANKNGKNDHVVGEGSMTTSKDVITKLEIKNTGNSHLIEPVD